MKSTFTFTALVASFAGQAVAVSVSGAALGFASGVTGGGDATPVYPDTIDELTDYLTSDEPQVIVLTKTFDYIGSEGTTTDTGCAPYGTGAGCQEAINPSNMDWCSSSYPSVQVTYDNAAMEGINMKGNKTIIGVGDSAVIRGKGLRMVDVSNIIIQNIHITDLNPQYVWGGDAFTFANTDLIWVDHCTTSLLGRQHYVFGQDPSSRIELSNNFINGSTSWSAGCDGYHYWTIELVGTDDSITFRNNYIYHTSGRGPALSGSTLFHAVNSVWQDINGHAIEGDTNGQGLFEGCAFDSVETIVVDDFVGHLFSSPDSTANEACTDYLSRACTENYYADSGTFDKTDNSFFSNFTGLTVADVVLTGEEALNSIPSSAGMGKLSSNSDALETSNTTNPVSSTPSPTSRFVSSTSSGSLASTLTPGATVETQSSTSAEVSDATASPNSASVPWHCKKWYHFAPGSCH